MSKMLFNNLLKYIRFLLRKERLSIVIWVAAIVLTTVAQAQSLVDLYPSSLERQAVAESMKNPAMIAMLGPAYGTNNFSMGALFSQQVLLIVAAAVGVMNILFMNRNSRGDEDAGRIEMVRGFPVGRLTCLGAASIVSTVVNILIALLIGVSLYALGIEGMDGAGCMLFGAIVGATGCLFTGITAAVAQIVSTARSCLGLSFGILGAAYFLRAIGDVETEPLSMVSPLGWILRAEVYVNNFWWPMWLSVGIAVVFFGTALYLCSKRDFGEGIFSARAGKSEASGLLRGPLGLAVRLLSGSMIIWLCAILVLNIAYGSLVGEIEKQMQSSEIMMEIFAYGDGNSLIDQFSAVMMTLMSIINTIPVLISIARLKEEEKSGRAENMLARPVSRSRMMMSYLLVSVAVSVIAQLLLAIGFWLGSASVLESPLSLVDILSSTMAYLPAIWCMIALTVVFLGWFPKGSILVWIYFGYTFFVFLLGAMLQLPNEMIKISLYENIPKIPLDDMNYPLIFIMTLASVAMIIWGFIGYRKRDLKEG